MTLTDAGLVGLFVTVVLLVLTSPRMRARRDRRAEQRILSSAHPARRRRQPDREIAPLTPDEEERFDWITASFRGGQEGRNR